jgi:carboxypeptidase Q
MRRTSVLGLTASLLLAASAALDGDDGLDWATIGRTRDEGFRHSQVMETAAQITDVHGPRLTGSPQPKAAADGTGQQLEAWGLASARLESFPFGRGWSFERCAAEVTAPVRFPPWASPKAWTAGTNGAVRGKVVRVKVESEADVEKLKDTLAGLVVWAGETRTLKGPEESGVFKRYTEKQLDELETYRAAIRGEMFPRKPLPPVATPPSPPVSKGAKKGAEKDAARPAPGATKR